MIPPKLNSWGATHPPLAAEHGLMDARELATGNEPTPRRKTNKASMSLNADGEGQVKAAPGRSQQREPKHRRQDTRGAPGRAVRPQ